MVLKICFFFLPLFALPLLLPAQSRKMALLIGISEYEDHRWPAINGANDVDLLKPLLEKQGFEVQTLKNEKASNENIRQAIEGIINKAQAGIQLLLHFSGHGQQVSDLNNEEPDGFDETLIPYDCPYLEKADPDVANTLAKRIIDDWLDEKLTELRKKIGDAGNGQVLVLLDACQSGGGTRSLAPGPARGVGPLVLRDLPAQPKADPWQFSQNVPTLAPLVALFASAPGQLNYEISDGVKIFGSLSRSFFDCLSGQEGLPSYQHLFETVYRSVQAAVKGQTPVAEGDLARQFMGSKIERQAPHYTVVRMTESDYIYVREGWLSGLYTGTELAFFPPDTWAPTGAPLAVGKVKKADMFGAEIELDRRIDEQKILPAWGYITEWRTPDGLDATPADFFKDVKETSSFNKGGFGLDFEIQPFKCDEKGKVIRDFQSDTLAVGDCFSLTIYNQRETECYFQILDFPVAKKDTGFLLIPTDRNKLEVFSVKGNSRWESVKKGLAWRISPLPDGMAGEEEVLKLVVAERPFTLPYFDILRGVDRGFSTDNQLTGQNFALYHRAFFVIPKQQ